MRLDDYLKKYKISVVMFCKRAGICTTTVWRLKVYGKIFSYKKAKQIETITMGNVTADELLTGIYKEDPVK